MAYASGSGNNVSRKNIASYVETMKDHDDDVMAVLATQSQFGISLWGAIDGLCRKRDWTYPAGHEDMPKRAILVILHLVDEDNSQPVVVRRVQHQDKQQKRMRDLATQLAAKRKR